MTSPDDGRDQRNALLAQRYEAIAPQYGYLIRRVLQGLADEERLTIPQFRTLQTLRKRGEPGATNLDLARRISVSPPAMTAMIDGLVDRGFVTRTIDPVNRRQVLILLTEMGIEQFDVASRSIEAEVAKGINLLGDQEAASLAAGLDALERVFTFITAQDET
jgi:DNA-binding MarR family transcriptional regulator